MSHQDLRRISSSLLDHSYVGGVNVLLEVQRPQRLPRLMLSLAASLVSHPSFALYGLGAVVRARRNGRGFTWAVFVAPKAEELRF
jgi:hypothetical protein